MDRTVPKGAALSRANKYHVYRSLLDLIGLTLKELDALQTKMLSDPDKMKLNSSAAGRYQIVRTTARAIRKALPDRYPLTRKFDADCQDEMACYLLGVRGIDKYLAGRLSEDALINNLAHKWASLPKLDGKGAYAGQPAAISVDRLRNCLSEVKNRHMKRQPVREVAVPVEKPVVPEKVKEKSNWLTWLTGGGGLGTIGLGWLSGMDWQAILAGGVVLIFVVLVLLLLRSQIIAAVRQIKAEVGSLAEDHVGGRGGRRPHLALCRDPQLGRR